MWKETYTSCATTLTNGYREWLAFEDVLKILPKSWFKKLHEANMTSLVNELARCAHAKCFLAEDKPAHRLDHSQFSQPTDFRSVSSATDEEHWVLAKGQRNWGAGENGLLGSD